MEISDITNSIKTYPLVWASGLLSILMGLYVYFTFDSVSDLERKLYELERQKTVIQSNIRESKTLEENLNDIKEAFQTVESRLIDRNQIANNNGFFYEMAQDYPVELIDVTQKPIIVENPKPSKAQIWTLKNFCVIPFEMSIVGYLTDVMEFHYAMEQCERFTQVRQFNLKRDYSKDEGYMSMNIQVNVLGRKANTNDKK